MHLNFVGTSLVLRLLAATQLTDAFQLVVETEEAEVIQAASSKSLCVTSLAPSWPWTILVVGSCLNSRKIELREFPKPQKSLKMSKLKISSNDPKEMFTLIPENIGKR